MVNKFFVIILIIFTFLFGISSTFAASACTNNLVINSNIFGTVGSGWKIYYGSSNTALRWAVNPSNAKCTNLDYGAFSPTNNWLDATLCNPIYNSITKKIKGNFNLIGNKLIVVNYLRGLNTPQNNLILQNNLWMHANVTYLLVNSSNQYTGFSNTIPFIIDDIGVLLPNTTFTQSYIQSLVTSDSIPVGIYHISAKVTPTDNKCRFNGVSSLRIVNSTIINSFGSIPTFSDTDADGVPDNIDKCKTTKWDAAGHTATSKSIYRGCPFEYSKVNSNGLSCSANLGFDKINSKINIGGFWIKLKEAPLNKTSPSIKITSGFGSISYKLNHSGNYIKKSFSFNPFSGGWHKTGSCNLRKNSITYTAGIDCIKGPKGSNLITGLTKRFYKNKHILPNDVNTNYIDVTCSNGNWISSSLSSSLSVSNFQSANSAYKKYKYSNPEIKSKSFENIKKRSDGDVENDGNDKKEKIHCNLDSNICKLQIPGGSIISINLSKLSNYSTRSIKIYNDSGLIRTEKVDPILITLQANSFMHFKTANQALHFVNKTVELMKKFDIVKNLSYDSVLNISTIRISTKNFADGGRVQNLTIYQKIPKSVANSYDNITFISDGGGQRIVLDKDPIIGWYFNDTSGNTGISYNVSGNTEGGTIIITQEPILFNEGELIINYRQNKTGCNIGEVHLFDLVDIDNSKILNKNTGNYQVCITDLNSNIQLLNGNLGSNLLNISSYMTNGNISSNFSKFSNKLQLSVNNNSIYWDLKIQPSNPNGNFSCLGSYDMVGGSSVFGDCGFKPQNRIWLHLGADYIPPKTRYKIPYLSHSVRVELIASDNIGGSGLNKTSYCIINNSNPCQNLNSFSEYINPFKLSCPADWSCSRIIKYFSTDLATNTEIINEETLYLIDKGSACQSDCTAKPAPNRYLKECRNLNGCFYAKSVGETKLNIGLKVAKACNLKIKDSIVEYNATHQIQCPKGPFKLKQFTTEPLTFKGSNNCKSLIKTPYTIILKGEQLMLNIITCYNY